LTEYSAQGWISSCCIYENQVLAIIEDSLMILWDYISGKLIQETRNKANSIYCCKDTVISISDHSKTLKLWKMDSNRLKPFAILPNVCCAVISPKLDTLVTFNSTDFDLSLYKIKNLSLPK